MTSLGGPVQQVPGGAGRQVLVVVVRIEVRESLRVKAHRDVLERGLRQDDVDHVVHRVVDDVPVLTRAFGGGDVVARNDARVDGRHGFVVAGLGAHFEEDGQRYDCRSEDQPPLDAVEKPGGISDVIHGIFGFRGLGGGGCGRRFADDRRSGEHFERQQGVVLAPADLFILADGHVFDVFLAAQRLGVEFAVDEVGFAQAVLRLRRDHGFDDAPQDRKLLDGQRVLLDDLDALLFEPAFRVQLDLFDAPFLLLDLVAAVEYLVDRQRERRSDVPPALLAARGGRGPDLVAVVLIVLVVDVRRAVIVVGVDLEVVLPVAAHVLQFALLYLDGFVVILHLRRIACVFEQLVQRRQLQADVVVRRKLQVAVFEFEVGGVALCRRGDGSQQQP